MGDIISTHLDESKREMITARTAEVMGEVGRLYKQQYSVALFNSVRFEIEGSGAPQPQLLHRKVPLEDKSIFSGLLFQFLEENKKWRNRFFFVPDSYVITYYETRLAYERGIQPKGTISCAGYKVLTAMEQYTELINSSLPGLKVKAGSSPFLKCATQFPIILWHPYARHYYFCVMTEKEQQKWYAVFQDCVRHANNGLSEECKVQTPAFTDAVRLYRQAKDQYGTWDMMCGDATQILANLVMEDLQPELRGLIGPRLKGKSTERQRNWMLISDAVYSMVQNQANAQYTAVLQLCEAERPPLEASIRTDMDQIITSKEHVANKIRALVLPRAEQLLKLSVQPYVSSILDALMEPTSRGFAEVRDVFFRELVDMSKNVLNDGSREKLGEHMEKASMLAFHPVKMQSCYEKMEELKLEGLQQRFDVSSPSVFMQRAQILMREQMDNAMYTFEQLLHQSLESQGGEELCKSIQRCQERVLKKYDYDSSTVRKKFFREALLQIIIPYMLKQLSPTCKPDFAHFQELIFEDFSKYILLENIFEEVVLQSVMKDIMQAVKEAAVQRRHNLYRDSIVLTNSDPNLHLLAEGSSIDWGAEFAAEEEAAGHGSEHGRRRRGKQVVSMIQLEGTGLPNESCMEVPGVEGIPEEQEMGPQSGGGVPSEDTEHPKSPDCLHEIRNLISPKVEVQVSLLSADVPHLANGNLLQEATDGAVPPTKSPVQKVAKTEPLVKEVVQEVAQSIPSAESVAQEHEATVPPSQEQEQQQQEKEREREESAEVLVDSPAELSQPAPADSSSSHHHHDDSEFQSPASVEVEEQAQTVSKAPQGAGDTIVDPANVEVTLEPKEVETGAEDSGKGSPPECEPVQPTTI
ncbi:protein Niban 2a [Amia ocellicauda]|uniref:protein Niban 2a n=1 Tax=Amia ocellicauda TaxID=2972642 RepID=UPI003463DE94